MAKKQTDHPIIYRMICALTALLFLCCGCAADLPWSTAHVVINPALDGMCTVYSEVWEKNLQIEAAAVLLGRELMEHRMTEQVREEFLTGGQTLHAAAEDAVLALREADPYWDRPQIDTESWELILANPWHDIGDYTPELAPLEGQRFDERIVEAMEAFTQAAREEGLSVFLSSGYRSYEEQTYLFNRKAAEYGESVAATIVARPGTSEHQTGLCCDITDRYYAQKDRTLENTALYQWMSSHCQEYGFIVRFPDGKEDITGIIYEPWHFRYVGREAASYIMGHDLTLEEFLALYGVE